MENPYEAPKAAVRDSEDGPMVYVGFWARVLATIIDSIIIVAITYPALYAIYGKSYFMESSFIAGAADFLLSYVFPAIAVILFWVYRSATPGKMAVGAVIVDAKTGGAPSKGRLIGRYFAYYLSTIAFFLGFLWVAWDERKQGWHDKLAGTVVVKK